MRRKTRSLLSRFRRDDRGAAAVEFAVILPVMLLFYLGVFEGSQALIAHRKVSNAAETVGGIVARSPDMDSQRLRNVLMISDAIVGPSGGSAPEITITTVRVDAKGKATVDWSRRGTSQAAAGGSDYTLPDDLRGLTDAYFVFARVTHDYTPMFGLGGTFGTMRFDRTFAFRPRKGSEIPWT